MQAKSILVLKFLALVVLYFMSVGIAFIIARNKKKKDVEKKD